MQIQHKDTTVHLSIDELVELLGKNLLDQVVSILVLLKLPLDNLAMECDPATLEELFGETDDIDEERINNLYHNLKCLDTDDEDL